MIPPGPNQTMRPTASAACSLGFACLKYIHYKPALLSSAVADLVLVRLLTRHEH